MRLRLRHKILFGSAILAAVASATIAAGMWDELDTMARPVAHDAAARATTAQASQEYQARAQALQARNASFGDLWRAAVH